QVAQRAREVRLEGVGLGRGEPAVDLNRLLGGLDRLVSAAHVRQAEAQVVERPRQVRLVGARLGGCEPAVDLHRVLRGLQRLLAPVQLREVYGEVVQRHIEIRSSASRLTPAGRLCISIALPRLLRAAGFCHLSRAPGYNRLAPSRPWRSPRHDPRRRPFRPAWPPSLSRPNPNELLRTARAISAPQGSPRIRSAEVSRSYPGSRIKTTGP